MSDDVKLVTDKGCFRLRSRGIVSYNNKYLVMVEDDNNYYSFPGGHIHLFEDSNKAVIREIKEETNIDCKIERLLCISQCVYDSKVKTHEICYYYLLTPLNSIDTINTTIQENDHGVIHNHHFKWISLSEFTKFDLWPRGIDKIIKENKESVSLISYNSKD